MLCNAGYIKENVSVARDLYFLITNYYLHCVSSLSCDLICPLSLRWSKLHFDSSLPFLKEWWEREAGSTEAQREWDSQADSLLSPQPNTDTRLDPTTMRLWPEPRPRVWRLIGEPPRCPPRPRRLMCFWVCVKHVLWEVLYTPPFRLSCFVILFLAMTLTTMVIELELVRLIAVLSSIKWGVWVSIWVL